MRPVAIAATVALWAIVIYQLVGLAATPVPDCGPGAAATRAQGEYVCVVLP